MSSGKSPHHVFPLLKSNPLSSVPFFGPCFPPSLARSRFPQPSTLDSHRHDGQVRSVSCRSPSSGRGEAGEMAPVVFICWSAALSGDEFPGGTCLSFPQGRWFFTSFYFICSGLLTCVLYLPLWKLIASYCNLSFLKSVLVHFLKFFKCLQRFLI